MGSLTKIIRTVSIVFLLFNGANATIAGWALMAAPSGNMLGMSTIFLKHSPFQNFLIPGIILFVANGLFSLVVTLFAILKWKYYARLIFFQGVVLTGWIIIQTIMIQTANFLHIFFGGIGILLVVFGIVLEESLRRIEINRGSL